MKSLRGQCGVSRPLSSSLRDSLALIAGQGRYNALIRSHEPGDLNTRVSHAMRELIAARPWLTVYQLLPWASELYPVEAIWSNLKRSLTKQTCQAGHRSADRAGEDPARTRLRRMQYRPGLLEGFLAKTHCP